MDIGDPMMFNTKLKTLACCLLAGIWAESSQAQQAGAPEQRSSIEQQQNAARMPNLADIQKVPMPSEDQMRKSIEDARKNAQTTGKQAMDAAARRAQVQLDPEAIAKGMPRADLHGMPTFNSGRAADPMDLARQYREMQGGGREDETFNVIVFVSLTMPEETLKRIGTEAKKVGGVVVLRGMKYGLKEGTWEKSLEALKPLAGTGANVQINPELFQQFGIRSVPTIIVSAKPVGDKGCGDGACAAGIGIVVGDVSMEYALEQLVDRKDGVGAIARKKVVLLN